MNGSRLTRHSAAVQIDVAPGAVLMVAISGPLTGQTLLHIKAQVLALEPPPRYGAFLVDYRKAVLALAGPELDAVLEGEPPGATPTRPAAMVATPAQVEVLRAHAARMALLGHFRRVFTDVAEALRWAQSMARR